MKQMLSQSHGLPRPEDHRPPSPSSKSTGAEKGLAVQKALKRTNCSLRSSEASEKGRVRAVQWGVPGSPHKCGKSETRVKSLPNRQHSCRERKSKNNVCLEDAIHHISVGRVHKKCLREIYKTVEAFFEPLFITCGRNMPTAAEMGRFLCSGREAFKITELAINMKSRRPSTLGDFKRD